MKTLFILRHAEAAPGSANGDFERNLTPRGMEQAKALGAAMRAKNYAPTLVVCSAAKRTRQTLEGVLETVKIPSVEHTKDIYYATTPELLEFLQALDDKYESVLMVGHNPAIHELAAMLAADGDLTIQLARGYAPGTLSVLSVPGTRWKDVQPNENKLTDILGS
jgi:phosphohistidine phosphatase